ncbi:Proline utilization trans-activator [Kluyveromyces marxianus]
MSVDLSRNRSEDAEVWNENENENDEIIEELPAKKKSKRSSLACTRCRRRHIKCPGGEPCSKCLNAGVACEYVEPNKKLIVSMSYLQRLQHDLTTMKKENVKLQASLSERNTRLQALELLKKQLRLASLQTKKSSSSGNSNSSSSTSSDSSGFQPNQDMRTLPVAQRHDKDVIFQKNSVQDNEDEIVPNFAERRGRLVESRTGQEYFVGSSSMTLFGMEILSLIPDSLKKKLKQAKKGDSPFSSEYGRHSSMPQAQPANDTANYKSNEPVDEVLKEEGNAYKIVLAKNDGNNDISVNFTLPTYSYAMLLIDTFITYNDGCFYFFNEGVVKHNLKQTYDGINSFEDHTLQTIWFCKVLLIFATGEMYLGTANHINGNKLSSKETPRLPGSGFFEQASEIFSCLFSSGRVENVTKEGGIEVMLLYAFYLQVADCTVASYFYFGQALRACLILGWHVDAQRDSLTRFELEHRRRIWWTVYMFERMLSSKAGLPLSFTDNTITTELPDDFDMSSPPPDCESYVFPEAEYITNCVRITQINAQILNKMYQKQPDSNILPVLKDIVTHLLEWRTNLSDFLQVDFTQKDLKISRLCTNVFTEYFQGMNLAIRPLLFHFASIQLKQFEINNAYIDLRNYSRTISSLLNCSLQASINTIRSLWALMDQNMVALFGYMDREYIFTSACTLILFNAAFGIHDQTYQHLDHALKIFTKMRNLGNNPAGLRRAQLLKLMSTLDFHGHMSELILKHTDKLKPNFQYDVHDDRNVNIVSHVSTGFSSAGANNSISQSQSNESQSNIHAVETNATRLDSLNFDENSDIQKLLDILENVGKSDDKLWKEISDQAMWLGSTMDSIHPAQTETNLGDFKAEDFL